MRPLQDVVRNCIFSPAVIASVLLITVSGTVVYRLKVSAEREIARPLADTFKMMTTGLAENFGGPHKITQAAK